jgi:hypothetical protein
MIQFEDYMNYSDKYTTKEIVEMFNENILTQATIISECSQIISAGNVSHHTSQIRIAAKSIKNSISEIQKYNNYEKI